jgi:pimeloyl-ACP methyl ester carboxylesterase
MPALASLSPRVEAGCRKPAMGAGQAAVMRKLGFERFVVVRHDRSGRDAHRMARGHLVALERIAVLAIAPTASLSVRSDDEPDRGTAVGSRSALLIPRRGHGISKESYGAGLAGPTSSG